MFFIDSAQIYQVRPTCLHVLIVRLSSPNKRLIRLITQIKIILAPFPRLNFISLHEVTKVLRRDFFKRKCEATIFEHAVPIIYKFCRGF